MTQGANNSKVCQLFEEISWSIVPKALLIIPVYCPITTQFILSQTLPQQNFSYDKQGSHSSSEVSPKPKEADLRITNLSDVSLSSSKVGDTLMVT